MPRLRRVSDSEGHYGSLVEAIDIHGKIIGNEPIVGCALRVGTPFAGTYSERDWWMTTLITEILDDVTVDCCRYVRFKTANSEYEYWTCY